MPRIPPRPFPGLHIYASSDPRTQAARERADTAMPSIPTADSRMSALAQRGRHAISKLNVRMGPVKQALHLPHFGKLPALQETDAAEAIEAAAALWSERRRSSSVASQPLPGWASWVQRPRGADAVDLPPSARPRTKEWTNRELEFAKNEIVESVMQGLDHTRVRADLDSFAGLHGLVPIDNFVDGVGLDLYSPKSTPLALATRNIFTGDEGGDDPSEVGSERSFES